MKLERTPAPWTDPSAILTVADVARWLNLTVRQVQRLGVPYLDLGRKNRRYRVADVQTFLDAQRRVPGTAA